MSQATNSGFGAPALSISAFDFDAWPVGAKEVPAVGLDFAHGDCPHSASTSGN